MIKNWKFIAGVMVVILTITGLAVVPALADRGEHLANALGITEDQLEAAQQQAHEAAIQQALAEGSITEEQAERMLEGDGIGFGRHMHGNMVLGRTEYQALLASELGISTENLQTALEQARAEQQAERERERAERIAEAIANGDITQEQADMMQAQQNLRQYMNQEESQNILQAAYESVIAQAVANGVITQEQADTILDNEMPGLGGFGKIGAPFGGRHGGLNDMRGGFGGDCGGPGPMGAE